MAKDDIPVASGQEGVSATVQPGGSGKTFKKSGGGSEKSYGGETGYVDPNAGGPGLASRIKKAAARPTPTPTATATPTPRPTPYISSTLETGLGEKK